MSQESELRLIAEEARRALPKINKALGLLDQLVKAYDDAAGSSNSAVEILAATERIVAEAKQLLRSSGG